MRHNPRNLALIGLTTTALVPAAAAASGHEAGLICGKNYSKNSATGDYCVERSSSLSATSPLPPQVIVKHDGFSWGDAGAGAGAAFAVMFAAAGGTVVLRRRRTSSPAPGQRSPATS
jgi:hypothetical protein